MCAIAERTVLRFGTATHKDGFILCRGEFAGCFVGGLVSAIAKARAALAAHTQPIIFSSFDFNRVRHKTLFFA